MGKGGRGTTFVRNDFYRSVADEPHVGRRKAILKAHPEIETLFVPDSRPVPYVIAMVFSQMFLAYLANYMSWPVFFAVAYIYGGTVSHSLSLMTHELSHCLVFKNKSANEYFAMFCNMGMGIPAATTFKRYHMEHHQFQGVEGKDADIPTAWEGSFFNSKLLKVLYLIGMPIAYGGRPCIVLPKAMSRAEMINYAVVIASNVLLYQFTGYFGIVYLLTSLVLGHGLHPMSGHFIAEHYIYTEGQETYSYYGPLNLFAWNVGYHNEHHDFPRVPGWRLPQVRAMAPEFYDNLVCYNSWTYVLYKFVMDDSITPFSRTIRAQKYSAGMSKKDE
jgi:sphingolipid delta-4 desaturase